MLIDGSPVRAPEPLAGLEQDPDAPASVAGDSATIGHDSAIVVNAYIAPPHGRHLPQMMIATTIVAVLPLVASLALRASGLISSGWLSVGLAVALSLAASSLGSAYWRKRGGHSEVLFGELLLWGWIRSWRQERELANATRLLALVNPDGAGPEHPALEPNAALSVEHHEQLLRQLAGALEGQDVYLNGHSRRVARHATMIARGMGLSAEEVARVRAAAAVHDVGKLRTPKAILNKPARLTDDEFEVIKRHPADGSAMVEALGDPELTRIVRHHHERLDGAGYPDRLAGEAIPLGARIIAVADTFDAITSARPYRDAAPHQKAIDVLRQEAGTQLDPDAVRAFLAYYSGSRPTVVWAIITSSIRRFVSWLTGDPAAAATISASKVAAATAATAAIGAAAGAAPVPVVHHPVRAVVVHHTAPAIHRAGLRAHRQAVSPMVVPARRALALKPPKAGAGKPHRTPAHAAHAKRRPQHATAAAHARKQVSAPARKPAPGLRTTAGSLPLAGRGRTPRSTLGGLGTSVHAAPLASPVLPPARPAPARPAPARPAPVTPAPVTPPGHSQESHGNGNAYGHYKTHGNGNGGSTGHSDVTPTVTPPVTPPVAPAPPDNAGNPGDGNGTSHGHDRGNDGSNGNGNGNGSGDGTSHAGGAGSSGHGG